MSFSDAEKVDIRFYCGYPVYGATNVSSFGFRYFQSYGLLEFRMNNLSEPEEVIVREMLIELKTLRTDLFDAREDLDTDKAAVWSRNKNEISDKNRLYRLRRDELCDYLGIPFGMGLMRYSFRMVN